MPSRAIRKPWRALTGFCALILSVQVAATTLDLEFTDPDDRPVNVAKAELLLVGWGEIERIALEPDGHTMRLPMDADWLRSRVSWFDHQDGAYLSLQAPPFASIRSERFKWLGARGNPGPVTIGFPNGAKVVVEEGADTTASIVFRPKTTRRVRIVDPSGSPWAGMVVDVSMFWSQSNHCGSLTGAEPLGQFVADTDGWFEIPDGDFEYALELAFDVRTKAFEGETGVRYRLVTHLTKPETQLVVRQYPTHPLEMRVRRAGTPVAGAYLRGYWANCPCGACTGLVAVADAEGRISLPDFRPEEWLWLELRDRDNRSLWSSGQGPLFPTGVVDVYLAAPDDD